MANSRLTAATKVKATKSSGRYDSTGKRVLSEAEAAKVRAQAPRAKPFSVKTSKTS